MNPSSEMSDERPLRRESEPSNTWHFAWTMFWTNIAQFMVIIALASVTFQQLRNAAALDRANTDLRRRLFDAQTQAQSLKFQLEGKK